MDRNNILHLLFVIGIAVSARSYSDQFVIYSSGLLGTDVTFLCYANPKKGEQISTIIFWKLPVSSDNDYFLIVNFLRSTRKYWLGSKAYGRIANVISIGNNCAGFTFNDVECVDVGTYRCSLNYSASDKSVRLEMVEKDLGPFFGRPKPPSIIIQSLPVRMNAKNQVMATKSLTFLATCRANVGSSWLGRIQWVLSRQCDNEVILETDVRIVIKQDVSTQPADNVNDQCTKRVEHILKFKISAYIEFFKVQCFIQPDPKSDEELGLCNDKFGKLCNESETIYIFYLGNKSTFAMNEIVYFSNKSTFAVSEADINNSKATFFVAAVFFVTGLISIILGVLVGMACCSTAWHGKSVSRTQIKVEETISTSDL